MSLLELGVVALWLLAGSGVLWMLYTGLPVLIEGLRRPVTPIARLVPGEVEVEGVIEADSPVIDGRGRACAVVQVSSRGTWWEGSGKQAVLRAEEREGTLVGGGLAVRDRTGVCRLLVAPGLVTVSAPARTSTFDLDGMRRLAKRSPSYGPLVALRETMVLVEQPIEVGAHVLVSGHALEDDEASPDGYRGGDGGAFVIRAAAERTLLVSAGRRADLQMRAALPLALALAMAGACAWLSWHAWAIRQGVG